MRSSRFATWILNCLLTVCCASAVTAADPIASSTPVKASKFRIGVESIIPGKEDWFATIYGTWYGKYFTEEQLGNSLREVGAEFTLFYDSIAPRKTNGCVRATDMCRRLNMPYLYNNTYGDIYGPWVPGTGRAQYRKEDIEYAGKSGLFMGVVWDEVEHRQLHHIDSGGGPYFANVQGLTPVQCYEVLLQNIRAACEYHQGAPNVAEFVFPSMFHLFAEAGMTPAPKVCKESFNPQMLATAMGAALQYDRELWAVADLWGLVPFWGTRHQDAVEGNPAHSPDEYVSSLLTAYWMGADAVYTEALYDLITPLHTTPEEWQEIEAHPFGHRGVGNPLVLSARRKGYILTVYGKMHRTFARDYVPNHPRPYTFRDVKPEVAIVAFPDSVWSKRDAAGAWVSDKHLFGPDGPEKLPQHEAICDLWNILTHGVIPAEGLTFHNKPFNERHAQTSQKFAADPDNYPFDDEHSGYCPLNGVVVFDHKVGLKLIRDVPLIICTGEMISAETQEAIETCVNDGAKCLTLPHLLARFSADPPPDEPRCVSAGKGAYLVAPNFASPAVKEFIAPHLGPPDEVRYTFGKHIMHLKPVCGDERRLTATLQTAE